jgi:hypothetical protein
MVIVAPTAPARKKPVVAPVVDAVDVMKTGCVPVIFEITTDCLPALAATSKVAAAGEIDVAAWLVAIDADPTLRAYDGAAAVEPAEEAEALVTSGLAAVPTG